MLDKLYYGNSLEDWGISLLIIIGALLINKLLSIINHKVIRKFMTKSETRLDDILFASLEKPVLFGVILIAIWISIARLNLSTQLQEIVNNAYEILIVLNVTWFFARLCTSFLDESAANDDSDKKRFNIDKRFLPIIKRGVLITVWFIGFVVALHNIGITVTTLLGTLGIGGIAFALAAQDTIKNIFGGITIFVDKTFQIGDIINFSNMEGTVVDIGLRSTRIRMYDKRLVIIPNYKLTDAMITNISSEPGRRVVMELGLTYDTPPEKMQQAIEILQQMPDKIPDMEKEELSVSFTNFADSALVIRFAYFIRKDGDIFGTRSATNFEILRSFNQAGLNFAFPSRTIYIENNSTATDIKTLVQ